MAMPAVVPMAWYRAKGCSDARREGGWRAAHAALAPMVRRHDARDESGGCCRGRQAESRGQGRRAPCPRRAGPTRTESQQRRPGGTGNVEDDAADDAAAGEADEYDILPDPQGRRHPASRGGGHAGCGAGGMMQSQGLLRRQARRRVAQGPCGPSPRGAAGTTPGARAGAVAAVSRAEGRGQWCAPCPGRAEPTRTEPQRRRAEKWSTSMSLPRRRRASSSHRPLRGEVSTRQRNDGHMRRRFDVRRTDDAGGGEGETAGRAHGGTRCMPRGRT